MRIAFVYCDVDSPSRYLRMLEIGVLQRMLEEAHHEVASVLAGWFDTGDSCLARVSFLPNVTVLFLDEFNWQATKEVAQKIRSLPHRQTLIAVGPYATIAPDTVLKSGIFDFLLVGEPDVALLELVTQLERKGDVSQIRNVWFRAAQDKVVRNPLRPLVDNLDSLPLPDRTLAENDWNALPDVSTLYMLVSRGCKYSCTFCYVPLLKNSYEGKGEYCRTRSPSHVAGELLEELRQKDYKRVCFVDEIFPLSKTWLRGFAQHLRKGALPPWEANVAVEQCDSEVLGLLAEVGCKRLHIGVETGNETFRKRLANRNVNSEKILAFLDLAREHEISVIAHVMIGLPLENAELAEETLFFLKNTNFDGIEYRLFHPIEKTPLGTYAAGKEEAANSSACHVKPPIRVPRAEYGGLHIDEITKQMFLLSMLDIKKRSDRNVFGKIAESIFAQIARGQITFGEGGGLKVLDEIQAEQTHAVLELYPNVSISVPFKIENNSVLRFFWSVPPRVLSYLSQAQKVMTLRITGSSKDTSVSLYETEIRATLARHGSRWQEVLVPLSKDLNIDQLTLSLLAGHPEHEELLLRLMDAVVLQEDSFLLPQGMQRTTDKSQQEIELLRARAQELEDSLTKAQHRQKELEEECARKTARIGQLQMEIIELQKTVEDLRFRLSAVSITRPSLWKKLRELLFRKKN